MRGIEHDRLTVTTDPQTAMLVRAAGFLAPVVRNTVDRHVRKAHRSGETGPGR